MWLRGVFWIFGMNGDLPSLDLAVVTHRPEGIQRVAKMLLPPIEGVNYIISWQAHFDAPIPEELYRPDVFVYRFDGAKGISANRNNALKHCRGDVILFADDDLIYYKTGLENLRRVFLQNPTLDFATFRSDHGDSTRFPFEETRLKGKLPKSYSVTSFEIAFRRVSCGDLRCCPELGLGSPLLHGGEDEIFLQTAIRRGLDCRFFSITVCAHPHDSTGTKSQFTKGNLLASGCVIAMTYPLSAFLRVPLKAWRVWRRGQATMSDAFCYICRGAMMARGVLKRNRAYLW